MQTGTQLQNNWKTILRKYIKAHKIIFALLIYFLISITLYVVFSIDILIPCLWKTLFNIKCPGCGLTTAFIKLITFDIIGAYHSNPLIFVVLPAGIIYIYMDIRKFIRKELNEQTD